MKASVVVILLSAFCAYAQETPAAPHLPAACGPIGANFDTEISTVQPPAQPEPGNALVFVAEDYPTMYPGIGAATIKIGLDGAWMGATHGSSYVFFQVRAGEHHLCIKWQSRLKRLSKLASFARLTAESGKTYYLRSRITSSSALMYLDLDAIDPDEGQYLVASSSLVTSRTRK